MKLGTLFNCPEKWETPIKKGVPQVLSICQRHSFLLFIFIPGGYKCKKRTISVDPLWVRRRFLCPAGMGPERKTEGQGERPPGTVFVTAATFW